MMMLLDGDVFNATRTIKELKENNLDNMITYFYQIGYSDTSDNLELPLVIKKQYPKALIDSKLLEERIKKNKLFDNKRASIELFKKYNIHDKSNPKTVISFMFKECHACKSDLPYLEKLMNAELENHKLIIATFSNVEEIDKILEEYELEYSLVHFSKEQIKNDFNVSFYPTNLIFALNSYGLKYELGRIKDFELKRLQF